MSAVAKSCGAAAALVAGVCVPLTVSPHANGAFLCQPGNTGVPGAIDADNGVSLLKNGWTVPFAVRGSNPHGDNLGAYTLTCEGGLTPSGKFIDQNGNVEETDPAVIGNYPIAS